MTTKAKNKTAAKKPAAQAKTKSAPKKVSKPVAKAQPAKAKVAPVKAKVAAKPQAKAAAKTTPKAAAKPESHSFKPTVDKAAVARPASLPPQQTIPSMASAARPATGSTVVATPAPKKLSFKAGELVVYPAHGVGKIVQIEEQEIAGAKLELYIVDFEKEKLRLKVPTGRAEQKGMRRLSDKGQIEQALRGCGDIRGKDLIVRHGRPHVTRPPGERLDPIDGERR